MAISAGSSLGDDACMATTTTAIASSKPRLKAVPAAGRRPLDRDDALRQVRSVRHHVESREGRFAHLKRLYD
jgi:hypothetical protein